MEITRNKTGIPFEDFRKNCKISRFESAFNTFFESLKFKKVDISSVDEKKILFEKYGTEIPLDSLSTGEKQIVFRGAYLLKNSHNMNGGVVLIDEPELSMHPKWQEKILQYYRSLFTTNGSQSAQMIIATHSEYILRSALENPDDILIITLNQSENGIKRKKITAPTVLPSITSAETNYLAFRIISNDYHIELYGYLQNKLQMNTVKNCDSYIATCAPYDSRKHARPSSHTVNGHTTQYQTLPTYIRNAIDHPASGNTFTAEDLKCSIELLIELCQLP